jgi:hypothetical protein
MVRWICTVVLDVNIFATPAEDPVTKIFVSVNLVSSFFGIYRQKEMLVLSIPTRFRCFKPCLNVFKTLKREASDERWPTGTIIEIAVDFFHGRRGRSDAVAFD